MHISAVRHATNAGYWFVLMIFVGLLLIAFAVMVSPFPFPIPSPTTLGYTIPRVLFPRPRPLVGDFPPRSWACGGETYNWRAAAPTLFVFVLTATCTMLRQDPTPGLAPSHHPCIQSHFTPTSCPPTLLHLTAISVCLSGSHTWDCPNRQ